MPLSPKIKLPYPTESADSWYPAFQSMVEAMDAAHYASREDRHTILMEGGIFTFTSSTGLLSWTGTLEVLAAINGYKWKVSPSSITLQEGEMMYLNLNRSPASDTTLTLSKSSQIPSTDSALFIAIRRNNKIYFRDGTVLQGDSSAELFGDPVENVSRFIPNPNSVTGTTETLCGSVYFHAGSITLIRAMLGSENPIHTASLRFRRNTGATLLTTLTQTGVLTSVSQTNIAVAEDFYDIFLFSSDPVGVAICTGVSIFG